MTILCFTIVRAFRTAAHHTAHRLAGHHIHHVRRAVVHRVATLHTAKLPVVVCVAAGLASLGAGGFVAGDKMFGSSPPSGIGGTINPSLSFGASGADELRVASLKAAPLLASLPNEVGGNSPDTRFSYNWDEYEWDEAKDLWRTPSTFAWREIGSPLDALQSVVWSEIDNLRDIPSWSSANDGGSFLDTRSESVAAVEPASISILVAGLFGVAVLALPRMIAGPGCDFLRPRS